MAKKKLNRIPTGCQEQLWALRIQQVSETKPLLSWEEAEKQICVSGNCKCQEGDIHKEIESEGLLSGWGVWLFYTGVREGFLKKWQLTRGGDWGGGKMKSSRQQKPQVQRPFVSEMYCLYSKEQQSGQFGWNGRSEGKMSGDEDGELARAYSEVKWSEVAQSCLTLWTPWTVAHQAPPSMGFSRQEYWSGLPFPSPGDLPDPGIKPGSPAL